MNNKDSSPLRRKGLQLLYYLKQQPILLIICFVIGWHGLIFIYTIQNPHTLYTTDSYEYLQAAHNLKAHFLLYAGDIQQAIHPDLYSRRPPLYPIFILLSTLVFQSPHMIIFFQILLYFLNLLLLWKILSHFKFSGFTNSVIALIYLFYPSQWMYCHMIMSEIVLQTLLLWALLAFLRFQSTAQFRHLLWYNMALSLAVLTKPILLYFWIPDFIIHLWIFLKQRRIILLFLPFLFILTIFSWSMRNYLHTGYFHYSSIKNFNLLYYNTHSFLVHKYGAEQAEKFVVEVEAKMHSLPFADRHRFIEKSCTAVLMENAFDYSFYHLRGVLFFFIDPGRYDIYQFLNLSAESGFFHLISQHGLIGIVKLLRSIPPLVIVFLLVMVCVNIILFISFILFIIKGRLIREGKWFIIGVILYFALLAGPLGASRMRLPVFPYLILTLPILFSKRPPTIQVGDYPQKEINTF